MNRHFWVLIHRYAGLTTALFLSVVGLTGSVLAFYYEIDGLLKKHRAARLKLNSQEVRVD
jgi:uncharacterized iron-regulated membrane protein